MTKRNWGAFYGTDLDLQLRRRDVARIAICGISRAPAWIYGARCFRTQLQVAVRRRRHGCDECAGARAHLHCDFSAFGHRTLDRSSVVGAYGYEPGMKFVFEVLLAVFLHPIALHSRPGASRRPQRFGAGRETGVGFSEHYLGHGPILYLLVGRGEFW